MSQTESALKVSVKRKRRFLVEGGKVAGKDGQTAATEPPAKPKPPTLKESFALLKTRWPKLFNIKNPKPLKIGTFAELRKAENMGRAERKIVALAISRYCNSFGYQKAMLKETHRYDLEGNPVQEIQPEHRKTAKEKLAKIQEKMKEGRKKVKAGKSPV